MSQIPSINEKKQNSEDMKSLPRAVKNKVETVSATTQHLRALKAEQPLKVSISDSCKKRLQSHTGLSHHPYRSAHPCNTRLDLNTASRDNLSSFTQRVMSAKLLRLKQLQNQLSEAHLQLNELCTENRLLRALQKRQDLALDRYEGSQAQLPQLVRSHQEEVRVLRTKYKNLKHQYRSVTNTLKDREAELQNLKEQHAHLLKISKDRHLPDRESLSKHVNELQKTVDSQASTIQVLNRRILLESKNFKFQLQQEMLRHKNTQSELQQTFLKLDQLQSHLDQVREKSVLPPSMDRLCKNTSLRIAGSQKPIRIPAEKNSTQISRTKKATKNIEGVITSSNTEPSSVQFGNSSPATSSGKTHDLSTSYDSSPEHTSNKVNASDGIVAAAVLPDQYEFPSTIFQKGAKGFNTNSDSRRNKRITGISKDVRSLSSDFLEKEYENAVAMLTELSTKHGGSFADDILSPLPSLDFSSAKHVAALANSTFALKEDLQSTIKMTFNNDEFSENFQGTQEETETPNMNKTTFIVENTKLEKINVRPSFLDTSNGSGLSTLSTCEVDIVQKSKCESDDNVLVMGKSCISNQESPINIDCVQKTSKNVDEEMDVSRKKALLRALKAIDDCASAGNNSGDDESPLKLSGSVIPCRTIPSVKTTSFNSGNLCGSSSGEHPFQ